MGWIQVSRKSFSGMDCEKAGGKDYVVYPKVCFIQIVKSHLKMNNACIL